MANKFLDVAVDTKKITVLGQKLAKYPPYAIQAGLKAAEDFLNEDSFRESMYPPESDQPFQWSSDKQRKKYYASNGFGRGIPSKRTHELMLSGVFHVNVGSLWVEYKNLAPYSKWVIHPTTQIIGHIKRGWKPINKFVVSKSKNIAKVFQDAVKGAWNKIKNSAFGESPGL